MSEKFKHDHFYRQFDAYPEGQQRFEAVARHAAYLLNQHYAAREEHTTQLNGLLELLQMEGGAVRAALAIVDLLKDD